MRKNLCVFLFFICFIIMDSVDAKEEFSVCKEGERLYTERRYVWYTYEEKEAYFIEGENPSSFPLLDEKKVERTAWSPWSLVMPEEKKNRVTEQRDGYAYQERKKMQYIFLDAFQGGEEPLLFQEITVYDKGERVPFTLTCKACQHDSTFLLSNQIDVEKSLSTERIREIQLVLEKPISIETGQIIVSFDKPISTSISFRVRLTQVADKEMAYYESREVIGEESLVNGHSIFLKNMSVLQNEWEEIKWQVSSPEVTSDRKVWKALQYRYQDLLYRYLVREKQYDLEYKKEGIYPYLYKDTSLYRDVSVCIKTSSYPPNGDSLFSFTAENESHQPMKLSSNFVKESSLLKKKKMNMQKEKTSQQNHLSSTMRKKDKNMYFYFPIILGLLFMGRKIYQKMTREKKF